VTVALSELFKETKKRIQAFDAAIEDPKLDPKVQTYNWESFDALKNRKIGEKGSTVTLQNKYDEAKNKPGHHANAKLLGSMDEFIKSKVPLTKFGSVDYIFMPNKVLKELSDAIDQAVSTPAVKVPK
jgi:hypothetical protein